MLYKVCMVESFAEEGDRVGIIEATDLHQATSRLVEWARAYDWGDYHPGEPSITFVGEPTPDEARVSFRSTDPDGYEGNDVYLLRPVGHFMLMFLAEDWSHIFD